MTTTTLNRSTGSTAQRLRVPALRPVPEYVRMTILNDDLHVVGHDWIKIGLELGAYLRKMVAEGGCAMSMQHRLYGGKGYVLTGSVPHVCPDRGPTTPHVWRTTCTSCGKPFKFTLPVQASKFAPNRRCAVHERPAARVRTKYHGDGE